MAKILVEIVGDSKKFKSALGSAGRDADRFGQKVQGGAHSAVRGLAIGAGLAAAGGIALLGKGLMDGIKTAIDHEKALAQTKAVIASTGGGAKVTAAHIVDLSDKIEKLTGIDDLNTQAGANMLLTFTNIKNGAGAANKVFDQSVQVLGDMTTALGSDPQKQAIQLGKALNDPIKGISALTRVGVSFTQGQKDAIKAMVDAGNTAGAQKLILKELNKEFGGSAKAAGDTMAGKVNILKAHLEDLEQEIGQKVIPVLVRLVDWAIANWPQFESAARTAMSVVGDIWSNALEPALKGLIEIIKKVMGLSDGWQTVILAVGGAIATLVIAIELYTAVTKIAAATQLALNFAMSANPIGLVVIAVAALVGGLIVLYTRSETVRDIVNAVWKSLKDTARPIIDWFTDTGLPALSTAFGVVATAISVAVGLIKGYVQVGFDIVKGVINVVKDFLNGDFSKAWTDIKATVGKVFEDINKALGGLPGKILGFVKEIGAAAASVGSAIVSGILNGLGGLTQALINAVQGAVTSALNTVTGGLLSGGSGAGSGKVGASHGGFKVGQHAAGGIFNRPTLGIIGEAGPEAVIPLSRLGAGGGVTVNVYPQNLISTKQELVEAVRNELIRLGRNTTGGALGRFA